MHLTPEQWDWVIRAAIIVLGMTLKRATWYPTKFVPVASAAISILLRLATGLGIDVPQVTGDAVMATGAYSGLKNIGEGLFMLFRGGWKAITGKPPAK